MCSAGQRVYMSVQSPPFLLLLFFVVVMVTSVVAVVVMLYIPSQTVIQPGWVSSLSAFSQWDPLRTL